MPEFSEKLLQFIWQHKLLKPQTLFTTSGNSVTILNTGTLNTDAGPDFFNGQIKINDLLLAGNIELHLQTSDWLRHGHTSNKSYDNIILHVVYEHDLDLEQNLRNNVEILELKNYISQQTIQNYNSLVNTKDNLPCSSQLKNIGELKFISWMERMTIERLEDKINRIELLFNGYQGDYSQTFYAILLRNFGFKVNGLPFELLAKHLPLQVLSRHSDNLLQLEALLLGVCGMLDDAYQDKYIQSLQNEFVHLKNKYKLTSLSKEIFKFSRLRPANFPNLRLVQFAILFYTQPNLFFAPQNFKDILQLKEIFEVKLQGYWKNHYTLDGKTSVKSLSLGEESSYNIIINTMAPFFFFYSKKTGKTHYTDLAIDLLSKTAFEKNTKTRLFAAKKETLKSAADSQGIINLYDNYCIKKQCLRCGIGSGLLNANKV